MMYMKNIFLMIHTSIMNDYLNGSHPHMHDSPTIIYNHSNFMNDSQSPKHLRYINGTDIYIQKH